MFAGKPIIGIAGGIGSGKSYVAQLFGELGCLVIESDALISEAYQDPAVKQTLRQWWGDEVIDDRGEIQRAIVARRVFNNPEERQRLERLLHPIVAKQREVRMRAAAEDTRVRAYVWDTPLLFETGLNRQCDAVVFVDAPFEVRLARVARSRGWDSSELRRREKLQTPLDTKREIADYVVDNATDHADADPSNDAGADLTRGQVREAFSRILASVTP